MEELQVKKEKYYGRVLYYPINGLAKKIAGLMHVKTFTESKYRELVNLNVFQLKEV